MRLVVGRIGRAHGIRGDVAVEVRTDDPGARFADDCRRILAEIDGMKDEKSSAPQVRSAAPAE